MELLSNFQKKKIEDIYQLTENYYFHQKYR